MKKYIHYICLGLFVFLSSAKISHAVDIPAYTPPIIDEADLISGADEFKIQQMIRHQTNPRILIVTLHSDRGEGDAYFSDLMTRWGIPQNEIDNTLFIGLARQTKRIAVIGPKKNRFLQKNRRDVIMQQLIEYATRRDFSTGFVEAVKTAQNFLQTAPTHQPDKVKKQKNKHRNNQPFDNVFDFIMSGFIVWFIGSFVFNILKKIEQHTHQVTSNKNALLQGQLNQKISKIFKSKTNQNRYMPLPLPVEKLSSSETCSYHKDPLKRCADYSLFGFAKKRTSITSVLSKIKPVRKKGPRIIGEERQSGCGREF